MTARAGRRTVAALGLSAAIAIACQSQVTGRPARLVADCCALRTSDGRPFYWLGDTAWDLFRALDLDQTRQYAAARRAQGFNVALVQLIGGDPLARGRAGRAAVTIDAAGHLVADPAFLETARAQVRELNAAGITAAIVIVWGNNVNAGRLDAESARRLGETAGRALGGEDVIWLLGGDTNPTPQTTPVWEALGEGLRSASPLPHLMSYHPASGSSSEWFADASWLGFDAIQSGHARYRPQAKSISGMIRADVAKVPRRPVIDLESGYEHIPDGLYRLHPAGKPVADRDRIDAYDIRARAWLHYVSGAFGYTYGHLDVMKFWSPGRPQTWPGEIAWQQALLAPGAAQMAVYQAVRRRMGSPYLVPDERIVPPSGRIPDYARILAGCTPGRQRCLVYSPSGTAFTIDTAGLASAPAYRWIDPRSGTARPAQPVRRTDGGLTFIPPVASGRALVPKQGERSGEDWLLAIEPADASPAR